jgi:hypothetical protein
MNNMIGRQGRQAGNMMGGKNQQFAVGVPGVPNMSMLQKYGVNRDGWESIRQSLYDSASYPAAGVSSLSFFQNPQGQPGGFGGVNKTLSDTNMTLAGSLPKHQLYWLTGIEVDVQPDTPTVAGGAAMPAAYGAPAVAVSVNDVWIIRRSGNLQLQIGSKPYLQEAPLTQFPASRAMRIDSSLADATTAAANAQSRIAYAHVDGPTFSLSPAAIMLEDNQNFAVTLNWPEGAQAITNPARIFVRFTGLLYRKSQ